MFPVSYENMEMFMSTINSFHILIFAHYSMLLLWSIPYLQWYAGYVKTSNKTGWLRPFICYSFLQKTDLHRTCQGF